MLQKFTNLSCFPYYFCACEHVNLLRRDLTLPVRVTQIKYVLYECLKNIQRIDE